MLKYFKGERVYLRDCGFDEKWLQDQIARDPAILGLGDVQVRKEKKQPTGGRIDFLLHAEDEETAYEVEVQLGASDESHIIRTIEYWDIERRLSPNKTHIAVLVAEDITNRFFNVIHLMNRSIPIIAIQLNAINVEDKIILSFTKVLDMYQEPEYEEKEGEQVNKEYWINKSSQNAIEMIDELVQTIKKNGCEGVRESLNTKSIPLGTPKRHFVWFQPRKKGHYHIDIDAGNQENVKKFRNELAEIGIDIRKEWEWGITFLLPYTALKNHQGIIEKMVIEAYKANE